MKKILILLFLIFSFNLVNAEETELVKNSKSAILMDYSTGKILYDFNSNEELAPASMTKIASLLVIMEAIEDGKINLDDKVSISAEADSMGGSQVYLEEGETYVVKELIKAVSIASGNDAVVALAEAVAGSVENFVDMMNKKCEEIGCKNTNFVNPHGLDENNHYSSSYDMALLAKELIKYDLILEYSKLYEDYFKRNDGSNTWMVNTNKLLRYYVGVDGLKTGYTENAGYCLTSTALKKDLRLISVVMGSSSSEKRSQDTIALLDYGFSNYSLFKIKDKSDVVDNIKVLSGKVDNVNIYLKENSIDLKKIGDDNKEYKISYEIKDLKAPLKKNEVVGKAIIKDKENKFVQEVDIVIHEEIKKANLFDYIKYNFRIALAGK